MVRPNGQITVNIIVLLNLKKIVIFIFKGAYIKNAIFKSMHNFSERVLPPLANVPPLELASFLVTVFFLSLIWEAGAQRTKCSIRSETLSDRSCVVGCLLFSQTDTRCFGNASIAVCCSSCVIDTDGFIRRRRFTVVVRL